jgi:threonine dehydratase
LYSLLHPRRVTEFSYRHGGDGATSANIFVSFQAKEGASVPEDKEVVLEALNKKGFKVVDFSQNELAKAHARYLSGGRAALKTQTELLYRFEFPEAPGALSKFLQTIPEGWNISMWHYRNCGHDIGRVLVGIIINPQDKESFNSFLTRLGYIYYEETDNTAYLQFLR